MSKDEVARIFTELGAVSEEKEITCYDILEYLGLEKIPNNIGIPLGKMKKSGEIIAKRRVKEILVEPSMGINGTKKRNYIRRQPVDYMHLNNRKKTEARG